MNNIAIRDAVAGDAPALAEVCVMAAHGVMELFYEGLVPGKSVADCVIERRILVPESFASLPRWRVAVDGSGTFLGALNSLPHQALMDAPDDPLLDEARMRPIAGLLELEAAAPESYYVNIIAVYPQYRRSGAGFALMEEAERLARLGNFRTMSLCTFGSDPALQSFYRRQGFEIRDTRPIEPHPAMGMAGTFALMVRELQG
jgi:ribosomal protein S18 acetylase RimI-like enzyme